jgi:hypothetical protein
MPNGESRSRNRSFVPVAEPNRGAASREVLTSIDTAQLGCETPSATTEFEHRATICHPEMSYKLAQSGIFIEGLRIAPTSEHVVEAGGLFVGQGALHDLGDSPSETSRAIRAEQRKGKKNEDNDIYADVEPHAEPCRGRGFQDEPSR